jgi:hypothetical protein
VKAPLTETFALVISPPSGNLLSVPEGPRMSLFQTLASMFLGMFLASFPWIVGAAMD